MRKTLLAAVAVAAMMAGAGVAQAVPMLTISGGVAYATPATNNVLGGGFLGFLGSVVGLTEAATVRFEFTGYETAHNNNTFDYTGPGGGFTFTTNPANTTGTGTPASPLGPAFDRLLAAGDLPFEFGSPEGPPNTVTNGVNNSALANTNFFAGFDPLASAGQALYLALDDGGAGPDDNHDDLVVRVSIVSAPDPSGIPEPATLAILGTALAGIGLIRRRRS